MFEQIEEVYTRYYADLCRFLSKLCSERDVIDDIIQNTFLEALKNIDSFRGNATLQTWLYSIAKYQLYRYWRTQKKEGELQPETTHVGSSQIDDQYLANEIIAAINHLPPPQKEIMQLRLIYGWSFKEIGQKINQSENYCRVNYYRIKEKLRKEYGDANM